MDMGIEMIISAPYSFEAAPIELFFAYFKQGEFNKENIKVGKK